MSILQPKRNFGTVSYQDQTLYLTEDAYLSNRVFPGWWGDVATGEAYTAEYEALACDGERKAGDPDTTWYVVRWQFDAVKGEEPEDEGQWPWDDEHIVKIIPR